MAPAKVTPLVNVFAVWSSPSTQYKLLVEKSKRSRANFHSIVSGTLQWVEVLGESQNMRKPNAPYMFAKKLIYTPCTRLLGRNVFTRNAFNQKTWIMHIGNDAHLRSAVARATRNVIVEGDSRYETKRRVNNEVEFLHMLNVITEIAVGTKSTTIKLSSTAWIN